jgi:hypothetical protein
MPVNRSNMKLKYLLFILFLSVFSVHVLPQSVTIKPKKIVYTRKGKVTSKEKRTFTITYPVVSGAITVAAKKSLGNTLSYWRVFETTLRENLSEYDWLTEMSYTVNYNKNGVLDISLTQEGVGAYPDGETVVLIIDLKTGKQVKFADVFESGSSAKLAERVDRKLSEEKKEIVEGIKKDKTSYSNDDERNSSIEMVEQLKFTSEDFDEFSVSDKGVTIIYDAGFPHVVQALQPDGRYFFTWAEIKPFIKADSLLARFIR